MYLILSLSSVTIYLSKHTSYWKTPYIKSVHLSDFCFHKGSPFDAICDISVNTCEGWHGRRSPRTTHRFVLSNSSRDERSKPRSSCLYLGA